MSGSKPERFGSAARMRLRYAFAFLTSTTGGFRFGITMARANCRAVAPAMEAIASPSRRCACQSSGRVIVMESGIEPGILLALDLQRGLVKLVLSRAGQCHGEGDGLLP